MPIGDGTELGSLLLIQQELITSLAFTEYFWASHHSKMLCVYYLSEPSLQPCEMGTLILNLILQKRKLKCRE